ncbi:MAG: hypothetical protein V1873_08530 [Verrucomicrobiota bacterium]
MTSRLHGPRALVAAAMALSAGFTALAEDFPLFAVGVGSQTFGPRYQFTADTKLVETAEAIYGMGSDIVKMNLASNVASAYGLPSLDGIDSLTALVRDEPSYRHVLDMPFAYYLFWTYPFSTRAQNSYWRWGVDGAHATNEYNEMYNLSRYLLRTYDNSGKTFLLGHWEGDWALLGSYNPNNNPSNIAIQGMTDWLRIRQKAVTDARNDEPHTNVFVCHYVEVNLLKKAMTGGVTMVNNILPVLTNDLISYSCYDWTATAVTPDFTNALAYIESKAHTAGDFYKNVFVGEYGYPLDDGVRTPQEQADRSEDLIKAAAGWGCPFVLYWQMYDNETNSAGHYRGFWLINDGNSNQPSYYLHRDFLGRANVFKNMYRFWLRRNPDGPAFANFAPNFRTFSSSALMNQILESAEFTNLLSHGDYLVSLFDALFNCTSTSDPDYTNALAQLNSGTSRRTVLDDLLRSQRFSNRCPNSVFAEMLLGGTLHRDHMAPTSAVVQAISGRLDAGADRAALWREYLDTNEFHEAELALRSVHERYSKTISTKYLFDFDRDNDGMPDAWERQIINADSNDAVTAIEDVAASADFDGDGLVNGQESGMATDPVGDDSDGDWLKDGQEVDGAAAFVDPLDGTTNLIALMNSRFEKNGGGEAAFLRTNSTPAYSEAIVDWQRGGTGGSRFSVTGTPVAVVDPVASARNGTWGATVQFFDSSGTYIGEPAWIAEGWLSVRAATNVAQLAAQNGIAGAAYWQLRFRIGPHDNAGTEPGFLFTRIAALPESATDPLDADSDDDTLSDGAEAVAGTDANDGADFFRAEPGTDLELNRRVVLWSSKTGRTYRVMEGGNLSTFSQVYETPGNGATQRWTNSLVSGPVEFIRLHVQRP